MRIIGGVLKGRTINPPAGYKARPTTDYAREGLFNILNNEYEFEDLKVLDLFGGTGAIAFEFASRGASRVYCVEMLRENASFIKTEAARLGLKNVTMVRDNVFDFLPLCHEKFDIVFADPPYALDNLQSLPKQHPLRTLSCCAKQALQSKVHDLANQDDVRFLFHRAFHIQ